MSSQDQPVFNGRYEVHRKIARGGMADVYLARDLMLDRSVALKVLFPEFATDPTFVQRFRGEARSAANLSHPNIVSIYDWGEQAGTYFIVMEYIEGRSLAQIVHDEGPMDPRRAADVTADIAAALSFAHGNGVIHRDVKPGNVLISPTGQVKVTDFGIARAVSSQDNLTQTGTVMGTATYFSPEQAKGDAVDPRSDVYSLGIVLYELLAGEPPFRGDSPVSVAYKHVQEPPRPLTGVRPDVPAPLAAVAHKAIAKDPHDRYASADALRLDLRRFSAGQPVTAGTMDATTAMAGAPTSAMAATGVGATRAVPSYQETWATTAADDPRYDEEPEKKKPVFAIVLAVALLLLIAALFLFSRILGGDGDAVMVEVPDVVGETQANAVRLLEAEGLVPVVQTVQDDEVPPEQVISQSPEAGEEAGEGDEVTIEVSAGPEPVEVPRVVGLDLEEATEVLEAAGFEVDAVPQADSEAEEGEVVRQTPEPGDEAAPESTVRIYHSSGPGAVDVPDVTGQTESAAAAALGRAGFEVERREEPSDDVDAGQVIRTEPSAGTPHTEGETVVMIVSSGPSTQQVPDVVGRSEDEARRVLGDAGFNVDVVPQTVNSQGQAGQVLSQNPGGGNRAAPDSVVTITVGEFFQQQTTTTTTGGSPGGGNGNGNGNGGGGGGGDGGDD